MEATSAKRQARGLCGAGGGRTRLICSVSSGEPDRWSPEHADCHANSAQLRRRAARDCCHGGPLVGDAGPGGRPAADRYHQRGLGLRREPSLHPARQRSLAGGMYVPVKKIVVHHTATTNDYSDGAAEVRAIHYYHAKTQRWGDIGYNLLIDNAGNVYEGRHGRGEDPATREIASSGVVAGHCLSHNYGSTGITVLATSSPQVQPTPCDQPGRRSSFEGARNHLDPQSVSDFLRSDDVWHDSLGDHLRAQRFLRHGCPGAVLYAMLPELRATVAGRLSQASQGALSSSVGAAREVDQGTAVTFEVPAGYDGVLSQGWYKFPGRGADYLSLGVHPTPPPSDSLSADPQARLIAWQPLTGLANPYTFNDQGHFTLHARVQRLAGTGKRHAAGKGRCHHAFATRQATEKASLSGLPEPHRRL